MSKKRGMLNCIVNTGLPGFSYTDKSGNWKGFDADMCRSLAAAVLGDGSKVKYIPATGKTRFTLLNSKEGDVIFRNTTWTFVRDVDVKLTFIHPTYYDGQGFIIRKSKGVKSAKDLDGATVCIQTGTTTELNLADFFRTNKISYKPVPIESNEEARKNYLADRCDTYTTDASALAATRATFENPNTHSILPEIISKEPLGPVVRHGDNQWEDIVRWTVYALIAGEEYGITKGNADAKSSDKSNPNVSRLL
jgi:general L-amino acid transport system substrate-binding protein